MQTVKALLKKSVVLFVYRTTVLLFASGTTDGPATDGIEPGDEFVATTSMGRIETNARSQRNQ